MRFNYLKVEWKFEIQFTKKKLITSRNVCELLNCIGRKLSEK
jgi:hypothetical protein